MLQSLSKETKSDSGEAPFTRQGSLRRVLPSGHNKENLFGRQNEDLNKFYKAFHQEYAVLAEYQMIMTENVRGVYVIPSRKSSLLWFGVIFVRSGMFEDGVFRFTIQLDEGFPHSKHPSIVFQSELFHPVIDDRTNELNLLGGFPVWAKSEQHIWQVLKYIHWVFHNVSSSAAHAVNPDALNMLRTDEPAFKTKARECVEKSREHLYDRPTDDDKHYIRFEPYTPHIHDPIKATMLRPVESNARLTTSGHSWVKDGTFRPLTREPSLRSESES